MPRQPPRERTPRARAAAPSGGADSDGDGIDDAHDRCPHRAEDHDGYQDDDGCPEASPDEDVDDPRALLELHVTYALNAAALPPRFAAELRAIARALTRDPSIRGVRIVGHADELGDPGYNQDLSERRARVVLEFLVRHGVASDRLEAVGVGSSQPIVHGASPLELAPNRRVEFIVLDARPAGAR